MNLMAAQRGAVIRRIFVIATEELKNKEVQQVMDTQVMALREVGGLAPRGRYEGRILEVSAEDAEGIFTEGPHFELIAKQREEVAVFLESRGDDSIVGVRFRAGRNPVGSVRGLFERYWEDERAIDLRKLPTCREIERRAYQIYVARGQKHGFDVEDWTQALRELIEGDESASSPEGEKH